MHKWGLGDAGSGMEARECRLGNRGSGMEVRDEGPRYEGPGVKVRDQRFRNGERTECDMVNAVVTASGEPLTLRR